MLDMISRRLCDIFGGRLVVVLLPQILINPPALFEDHSSNNAIMEAFHIVFCSPGQTRSQNMGLIKYVISRDSKSSI